MKYDLWYSESEHSAVLLEEADGSASHFKADDAKVIWSVDAEDYRAAQQKQDEFLASSRREGHVAFKVDTATTRFTQVVYLDDDGQQQSMTAPGWVGMVQSLIDSRVSFSSILGQIYFERPGSNAPLDMARFLGQVRALSVEEITIVDLRSKDGDRRMCQEFYGRLEDPARIQYMIWRRLDAEMSSWNIVNVHVLKAPAKPVVKPDQSAQARYADCRMVISPTGGAGFALGTTGKHAGYLYDVFVSPREQGMAGYQLIRLAVQQGGDKLVICNDSVVGRFFEQFGFRGEGMIAASDAPPNWVRDVCGPDSDRAACPDFVLMARREEVSPHVPLDLVQSAPGANAEFDARRGPCAKCGREIPEQRRFGHFGLYGGYDCEHCEYLHLCGTLTMGPPEEVLH